MKPDDIIPYAKIVAEEGVQLQKGMNYASGSRSSIFLMSIRKGAPYRDEIDTQSGNLIYEGHDEHQPHVVQPGQGKFAPS